MLGVWGMGFSIAGSIIGGILVRYTSLIQALWCTSIIRVIPLFAQCWLAQQAVFNETIIEWIIYSEHFCGGAITTVIFASMMSRVNKDLAATQFTAFATVEVLGKVPFGLLSGWMTEQGSYAITFGTGASLSVAFLCLLPLLQQESDQSPL